MPARAVAKKLDAKNDGNGIPFDEAVQRLGVQPHVLRYWETEFPALRSGAGRSKDRRFGPEEVALLEQIKHMLYTERLTVAGARRRLGALRRSDLPARTSTGVDSTLRAALLSIRDDLTSLRRLLA